MSTYSGEAYQDNWLPPISSGYRCLASLRRNETIRRFWWNDGRYVNPEKEAPAALYLPIDHRTMAYARDYGDLNEGRVGMGVISYEPDLTDAATLAALESAENVRATDAGLVPEDDSMPGTVVIEMQCPYPYLSASVSGEMGGGSLAVSYSLNNGGSFVALGTASQQGGFSMDVGNKALRRYSWQVRLVLSGPDACLTSVRIQNEFQCSQRALPTLVSGTNTIGVAGGPRESTRTIEAAWLKMATPPNPIYTDFSPELVNMHVAYEAMPAVNGLPATVTFPLSCPGDIRRLRFGGHLRLHGWDDKARYLVSCDDGETWSVAWENLEPNRNLTKFVQFDDIPPGTRNVLVRYELTQNQAAYLFSFRIDADYDDGPDTQTPLAVTYTWSEGGEQKQHRRVVASLPASYPIDVAGEPTMESFTVEALGGGLGGGVYCAGGTMLLADSIVRGNAANAGGDLALDAGGCARVSYCSIDSGGVSADGGVLTWEAGNIGADPLFADAAGGDFHLRSPGGRWDPAAAGWVYDDVSSPCIDAGDPDADFGLEPAPNFNRVNMGAYGNTAEASRSLWTIAGDVNGDCTVNVLDLLLVRNNLSRETSGEARPCDVNSDGAINVLDLISVRNRLGGQCR